MSSGLTLGFIAHKVHRHGGMERAAAEVLERVARKHRVVVCARECEIGGDGLEWRPVNVIPRPHLLLTWSFARRARRVERSLGCTLTNSIGAAALDADVITAQFCHAAYQSHCGGLRGGQGRVSRSYQRFAEHVFVQQERRAYTSPRLKRVIAVSEGVKRELVRHYGVAPNKIVVIPNGVDHSVFKPADGGTAKRALRRTLGLPEDGMICLFVGGDWERKGLADAIRAVRGLPETSLVVVGHGDAERFAALAAQEGAEGRVIFAGVSKRPQDYYAAADVFVFPSRYEAFSLVTLEAAAAGLPILALRINGTEELIADGVNGFFVAPTADSIRERLCLLQQDRGVRERMAAAALESSQRYTWPRIAQEQMEQFEALASAGGGA